MATFSEAQPVKAIYTKWLQLTAALLLGLLIGGYSVFSFTSYFFLDSYYTSLVAQMTMDIAALKKLRKDEMKTAIEQLDARVDTNIIALDVPETEMSKKTYASVLSVLKMADEYKREFGVRSPRNETEKLVSDALSRTLKRE